MGKYAILISGQPRNVLECFHGMHNNFLGIEEMVLKHNNYPDVFIHSWLDPDMEGKQYKARWIRKEVVHYQNKELGLNKNPKDYDERASNPIPKDVDKIILDRYKPKNWIFEKPKEFPYDKRAEKLRVKYMAANDSLSFFYSMYKANKLKIEHELENGFRYDAVLRIRFDTIFRSKFEISKFPNRNVVYTPWDFDSDVGICDRWSLASSKNTDIYTDVYPNLIDFVINDNVSWQNENALGYWVRKKNNLPIEIISARDMPYTLFRHNQY